MAIDKLAPNVFNDKPFYVYLYRDPRPQVTGDPIYVGKGTVVPSRKFFRADYHWLYGYRTNKFFRLVLNKIKRAGLVPYIEIVEWFYTERDALDFEISLIKEIGRRDLGLGSLLNLTDGGEGITGYTPPPDVIEKHRRCGAKLWEEASPELREAMSHNRTLWKVPEIHAKRCISMKAGRANRWSKPGLKELDSENIRQAKLVNGEKTSAQVKEYYATATPEKLAAHAKAISDSQSANGEKIGKTSEEVWSRPGMREIISAGIKQGQTKAWHDPIKKAARLEKLRATYAAKRAAKEASNG